MKSQRGELGEQPVDDAVLLVEQPLEHGGGADRGSGPGQQQAGGDQQPHALADPAHQQRDQRAEGDREGDADAGEDQGPDRDRPELRVGQDRAVVVQAGPHRLAADQLAQVELLERGADQHVQRVAEQPEQEQHARHHQPVRQAADRPPPPPHRREPAAPHPGDRRHGGPRTTPTEPAPPRSPRRPSPQQVAAGSARVSRDPGGAVGSARLSAGTASRSKSPPHPHRQRPGPCLGPGPGVPGPGPIGVVCRPPGPGGEPGGRQATSSASW